MSILYEFYRNPNSQGTNKKRFHARVVPCGKVSTDQLAKEIQKESSLTEADVKAVLVSLADKLAEHLGEGRKVHLDGIGYFSVNLKCKEEVRSTTGARSENIEFKSVAFRADAELKNELKKQKIRRSKNKPHSVPLSEEVIDKKLTEHFSEHPILTRHLFQFMFNQRQSTASRMIKQMVEKGKLKNVGTPRNPVYVPDNGYYTSVAE